MKKRLFGKKAQSFLVILIVAVLAIGLLAQPSAQAVSYNASFIKEYTGNLQVNYQDYLNTSVMQKLLRKTVL